MIVRASLDLGEWLVAGVALLVGLLTIFSMTKIWAEAFWKAHPEGRQPALADLPRSARWQMMVPIIALAVMTVVIGAFPSAFLEFATKGAEQLLDPAAYVAAVLGEARR